MIFLTTLHTLKRGDEMKWKFCPIVLRNCVTLTIIRSFTEIVCPRHYQEITLTTLPFSSCQAPLRCHDSISSKYEQVQIWIWTGEETINQSYSRYYISLGLVASAVQKLPASTTCLWKSEKCNEFLAGARVEPEYILYSHYRIFVYFSTVCSPIFSNAEAHHPHPPNNMSW